LPATRGKYYRNRLVQDVTDQWRHFAAACHLVRMNGLTTKFPFQLPRFVDPITSQPIVSAVLCPCGQTYDRWSIEQYIQQTGTCPMTGHPLQRKNLYVNWAVQRMIAERP
jgi:hypothetical protein